MKPRIVISPRRRLRSCPLTNDWRRWHAGTVDRFRLLDPADQARAVAALQALRGRRLRRIEVLWERAIDDVFYQPERTPGHSFWLGSPSHLHTSFRLERWRVHIDRLMAERRGPGCVYLEYRIFIDGRIAGRGGMAGGPYGCGNNDLPAAALLGERRILTVDWNLNIEVWSRAHDAPDAAPATASTTASRPPAGTRGPRRHC